MIIVIYVILYYYLYTHCYSVVDGVTSSDTNV